MDNELGWQIIRDIHDFLKIDEEWTQWHDDGFTWWAHQNAQRFRFDGPHDLDGAPTTWVTFETDVLRNLPVDPGGIASVVAADNRINNLYEAAIVGDRLVFRGRTYALPETAAMRARLIANTAIIANVRASFTSKQHAEMMKHVVGPDSGIEPAHSEHPVNGRRAEPDDMLTVVERFHLPHGRAPVALEAAPDLAVIATWIRSPDVEVHVSDDEQELVAALSNDRLPFLLKLSYRERHHFFGSGMLALLKLPLDKDMGGTEAQALAAKLNEAEWTTHTPLVTSGAWVSNKAAAEGALPELVHAVFHPNLNLRSRAADNVLSDAIQRMLWLHSVLETPEMTAVTA